MHTHIFTHDSKITAHKQSWPQGWNSQDPSAPRGSRPTARSWVREVKRYRRRRRRRLYKHSKICDDYRQQPITSCDHWPHHCGNMREFLSQREQCNSIYQQRKKRWGGGGGVRRKEEVCLEMWSIKQRCNFPLWISPSVYKHRRHHTHETSLLPLVTPLLFISPLPSPSFSLLYHLPVRFTLWQNKSWHLDPSSNQGGCHPHLNIFSVSPSFFLPLLSCSAPTDDKKYREDDILKREKW